jgi:3-methyladenine DNA glycosylase/8-oxoguanine DNA glycosylase
LIEAALKPRGPYSFRLSSRLSGDATRAVRDGRLTAVFELGGRLERASAWQRPDGTLCVRADSADAIERLRFVLALDDDHSPFLERFARDPLLGDSTRCLRGLRPWRLGTVAQALLRALCGQLIQAKRARAIERTIVRAATPCEPTTGLHAPPSASALSRFAPAELRALGLGTRRGAALARLCRSVELERLHTLPTEAAAARLERERGLGPWSVGVVCLHGLGRTERGLVGDLGLIKLCSALRGRWAEAWETEELLAPYGEWAGLASVYLLAGWHQGLVPVPAAAPAAA